MPRLSRHQHHQNYLWLRKLSTTQPEVFAQLSPSHQVALHTYYKYTLPQTPQSLRILRGTCDVTESSLASRSGKAMREMHFTLDKSRTFIEQRNRADAVIRPI